VAGDDGACFSVALTNDVSTTVSSVATLTIGNLPLGVTEVSAGASHSVALKSDGTVWSWGSSVAGLRGVGSDPVTLGGTTQAKNVDGSVFNGVVGVSAGFGFTTAVKGNGTVWAWGLNGAGLGDGTTQSRSNPAQVVDATGAPFTGVTQASAGSFFTLAVKADGSVWGWGSNSSRMLGDGTNTSRVNPVPVLDAAGGTFVGAVRVAAGQTHSMALKADGTLWVWGANTYGQNGSGSGLGAIGLPTGVETAAGVPLANVVSFAAGQLHSAAVMANGTAYAWGHNTQGSLGDGTTTNRSRPVLVKDSAGNALTGIVAVAAGDYFTMFLKSDGAVWATGMNNFGQLGDNTAAAIQVNPGTVKDVAGNVFGSVDRIALSQRHTVVRRSDGSVWAWGENVASQLGDTTTTPRTNPVRASVSGP
jgi:alpha-tubulin suppressor-like RCC1 family protein